MKHARFQRSVGAALGVVMLGAPSLVAAVPFDVAARLGAAATFTVLGLEDGAVTINSATSITGDVGYARGVVSGTNQKVDVFDGSVLVHSGATFSHTPATFAPSGGILTGAGVDAILDQAHDDAVAASAFFATLSAADVGAGHFQEVSLGALGDGDDRTLDSTAGDIHVTRVNLDSLTYKEDTLTLVGDAGDVFILNVSGDFNFSNSSIVLQGGVSALDVVFNFAGSSSININKAGTLFNGRILAPLGTVDYHNPATFNGAVIAGDITLHSDFNVAGPAAGVTEPGLALLMATGLLGVGWARRRKR